jgi:LPXTG-site transpeptidase (sortase) family protein
MTHELYRRATHLVSASHDFLFRYNRRVSDRSSSNSGAGCAANLLIVAGVLLVVAAGIAVYPALRSTVETAPVAFGEAAPPLLRPTVTPLPGPGQLPTEIAPLVLPDSPLLPSDRSPSTPMPIGTLTPDQITASIPTRIVITSINLDAPIAPVGLHQVDGNLTWDVPNYFAAGWLNKSAMLGQAGNTVFDGHHNILGKVFANLKDLKQGDQIQVYAGDKAFYYVVTGLHNLLERDQPIEVRIENAKWMQATTDERITLITCWPPSTNTNRLIIVAEPVKATG